MNQSQPQQKQIQISDNIAGGEYSNAMQVSHNRDEFQMVFLNIFHPTGKVAGKLLSAPGHFKRMVKVMQENIKRYEEKFGEIQEAESVQDEIGFKPKE